MCDCIPSPSGPGPSADGIWHGLLPAKFGGAGTLLGPAAGAAVLNRDHDRFK